MRRNLSAGDLWGGLAATLVALPASVAFGVAMYAPLGNGAAAGALAGLIGATALGIAAPLLGGTPRLVSAPCAPAVAVMAAFAGQLAARSIPASEILLLMAVVGFVAGAIQIVLGLARAGTLIKYIPYPVVTGYMSGVAIVIFLKQLPAILGLPSGTTWSHGVMHPELWQWPALVVAIVTIAATAAGPRITRRIPAAIVGLAAGAATYAVIAAVEPALRTLAGNSQVIGPLAGSASALPSAVGERLTSLDELSIADLRLVVGPALTLAVVLSLDTLKTCVVVDSLTGSQHDSNRELFGQGVGNVLSAVLGGVPGSGTSGPTLVNIASGGETRKSAVFEGLLVMVSFVLLGGIVGWAPLAALAGILVVVAARMFDWAAFRWVRQGTTVFDFVVVIVVVAVAVLVDLITASAVGVGLSILLFIRAEAGAEVIRRKLLGNQIFSKRRRSPAEHAMLATYGHETVVVQLSGSLFFGTADQLRRELAPDLAERRTIIFDMRRVDAVDLTAVHILGQMLGKLGTRGARAALCNIPRSLAGQGDTIQFLREAGLLGGSEPPRVFTVLSDALAWAEDRLLAEHGCGANDEERPLELAELPMFVGRKPETVADGSVCVDHRHVAAGDHVFRCGDGGDEIFFVRSGSVRISLALPGKDLHVASVVRGDFFGEIAFLDGGSRTADAIAETDVELFVISRARFDAAASDHPRLAQALFSSISGVLAHRLRTADSEIATLEDA